MGVGPVRVALDLAQQAAHIERPPAAQHMGGPGGAEEEQPGQREQGDPALGELPADLVQQTRHRATTRLPDPCGLAPPGARVRHEALARRPPSPAGFRALLLRAPDTPPVPPRGPARRV
ncbi:hypothetical protein [Actinacidiphila glaucinigra]|uniref:hypothetical protein n=1 Tax=Actinacidiphila glaucinigra TaxID=235986 RepID=UPI003D8BF8FB